MKWKEQMHQLHAYQPGKSIAEVKTHHTRHSIIKLASNENPYGYSLKVDHMLKEFGGTLNIYPDGKASKLRAETASLLEVDPNQLIFTNGTDELIQIISRSLIQPGKNTVMATPTFSQYKHNAVLEGGEVREIPLIDGIHDLDRMLSAIDENTTVVWVCNPNNPTGTYITIEKLWTFLKKVPNDVFVVLDEAYFEYVEQPGSTIELLEDFPNVMITRTFSKIYGLASLRVGYGISSVDIIQKLEAARPPFNTNVLGQMAAAAAISDQEFVKECFQKNVAEREKYYAFCLENGLKFYLSEGNFVLIDFKWDGEEVTNFLLEKGIIVRSGKQLGFPTCVRITIGLTEQNERVREAIKEFIKERSMNG
ncbi:histidinol-phosphate transaminase [Heyndrickxia oleronia]|uniref:histidinol-phosphate transaminase n=1 Tax=Heyndrickxia oleronia TaxID=38875 RepID=UPI00203D80B2|nr:histidinol-phosphate transaminase [Heyndrickxia oleronia]MCM3236546.1 histidinol-phosphate transaminase [Heyndrickxia oleronia]